jgi:hypothetical protein
MGEEIFRAMITVLGGIVGCVDASLILLFKLVASGVMLTLVHLLTQVFNFALGGGGGSGGGAQQHLNGKSSHEDCHSSLDSGPER